jgi:hypothetical protein
VLPLPGAGTARDANSLEEIFIELNRVGFDGAVSIEWEDNDAEQHAGAKTALANARRADNPPSGMRHDEMLKARAAPPAGRATP